MDDEETSYMSYNKGFLFKNLIISKLTSIFFKFSLRPVGAANFDSPSYGTLI